MSQKRTVRRRVIHAKQRKMLLQIISEGGSRAQAALALGTDTSTLAKLIRDTPGLAEEVAEAQELALDACEDIVLELALKGHVVPVHYQGRKTDEFRRLSENMIAMLLRSRRPEKWRENQRVEVANGQLEAFCSAITGKLPTPVSPESPELADEEDMDAEE